MVTSGLVGDVDVVNFESDTLFPGWNDEESEPHQRRGTSPARALRTPCPFPEFSSPEGRGVITDDLNDAQKRQLEAVHKVALIRAYPRSDIDHRVNYGFRLADPAVEAKDAVTRSLRVDIVGPPAITKAGLVERKALRNRYLVLQDFPLDVYRTRLRTQRGGSHVPAMRMIPVVLAPSESGTDDEALFERSVQRHRELSPPRFEFAKLKARR
ncbi:uncharacterized protein PHALS_05324 [Plasmopara halstedii]|uniref:Uncharacterized protein n=1 Tax=Plasmopara halstedii TaxID=4781 RepID=A0A0P1A9R6_PLAHL|nr:uncharacterized protein PHALS_05324 [Plasmopara halstedii]CEG37544.1 hypothetical protein PHALS_05324 [Plasmopara halstedii]|eukprot:XP_024573913.1 hypothetical protein PHALS_05324 [Plasmopara halstedii]